MRVCAHALPWQHILEVAKAMRADIKETGIAKRHEEAPKSGAISCWQGEVAWKLWKARTYSEVNLSDGMHEAIKGAFLSFRKDVGQI